MKAKTKSLAALGLLVFFVAVSLGISGEALAKKAPVSTIDIETQPININKAGADELMKIRGVGPKLAQRIIDYRTHNGGFEKLGELSNVKGIGGVKFQKIKAQIAV